MERKMKYVRPDVYVERFALNDAVAACDPTSSTETYWSQQDITCLATTSKDYVFYSGCVNNATTSGRLFCIMERIIFAGNRSPIVQQVVIRRMMTIQHC